MKLSEFITIDNNFTRSINLAGDLKSHNLSQNYIWTSSNVRTIERIFEKIIDNSKHFAFSLIGPYGVGKSAFLLQLLHLLKASSKRNYNTVLNKIITDGKSKYFEQLSFNKIKPYSVVLTGRQMPIKEFIIQGITKNLQSKELLTPTLEKYLKTANTYKNFNIVDVIKTIYEDIKNKYNGFYIIIDELGKLLEYAVLNPSKSDIYILQQLAELRKSDLDSSFMILTVLHQSFESYARYLSVQSKLEWMKIQGRFETISLAESPDELVPLIVKTFNISENLEESIKEEIEKKTKKLYEKSAKLNFLPKGWDKEHLKDMFLQSYPFNPVAVFILPLLSRLIGQNSRSTFTYIGIKEPNSFFDFISTNSVSNLPLINIFNLYDYFNNHSYISTDRIRNRWAEVQIAVDRLGSENSIELNILKTIGILNVIQLPKRYPANESFISLSLEGTNYTQKEIKNGIKSLVDKKIIVYRRFSNEYRIWEGSDFNIEEAIEKRNNIKKSTKAIIDYLSILYPQENIRAKKHYEETGTLRYYQLKFLDPDEIYQSDFSDSIKKYLDQDDVEAEGLIYLVLCFNQDDYEKIFNEISKLEGLSDQFIFILPKPNFSIIDLIDEAHTLRDILSSEKKLTNDLIAQKEVKDRIAEAEDRLIDLIDDVFWGFNRSQDLFFGNELHNIYSKRKFYNLLSEIFTKVFNKAPSIHNELINRHQISAPIVAARKCIIKQIIANKGTPLCDLSGTKAETTIFKLIYSKTGFYRKKNTNYGFYEPKDLKWKSIWEELVNYIDCRRGEDIQIKALIKYFLRPPFGIRPNVFIFILLAYLEHEEQSVVLYEEGTYIPQRNEVIYELVCKRPELYSIQRVGGTKNDEIVLKSLAEKFRIDIKPKGDMLYPVVKYIYRIVRILPFHVINTRKINEKTLQIRNAILKANRPEKLILNTLPSILGFSSNSFKQEGNTSIVRNYAKKLSKHLNELKKHIEKVRQDSVKDILNVFGIFAQDYKELRIQLGKRAKQIENIAADPIVKNIMSKIFNESIKDVAWIDAVVGAISMKPINSWSDFDKNDFKNKCQAVFRTFKNYELLIGDATLLKSSDSFLVRYSITESNEFDINEVLSKELLYNNYNDYEKNIDALLKKLPEEEKKAILLKKLKELSIGKEKKELI